MTDSIDLDRVRAETPGCRHHIHLNNAGAALPPRPVLERQVRYLQEEAIKGGYETADAHREEIEGIYAALARLIGADRSEIALTSNATESWLLALHSFDWQAGHRILTGEAEYASNFISYLKLAEERGVVVDVIPSDEHGETSAEALEAMLDDRVRLVALTHVPTNGGLVNPAAGIGRVTRAAGIPFLLDACQSAGQLDLDVERIGCDFLSATGRKYLRGPRGTGFLYVRSELLDRTRPPFLDLYGATWVEPGRYRVRDDARRYETWEFNYASVLGLGAAVAYALELGMGPIEARVRHLGRYLRKGLTGIEGVSAHDLGRDPAGIVTFSMEGVEAEVITRHLASRGVAVSVTTPASTRIDAARRHLPHMVRASVHYYNTEAELDTTVGHVAELTRTV